MSATLVIEQDISQQWQRALDLALAAHDKESATAYYTYIALAFPSATRSTRDACPLLDYRSLKAWALARGWQVRPAPERAAHNEKHRPPVRFTRLA